MSNNRDHRVLTSDAANTNCLLQLLGEEWVAPVHDLCKGSIMSVVFLSLR